MTELDEEAEEDEKEEDEEDKKRAETILNICIQLTSTLAILCEPFMPFTSKKLGDMLNADIGVWKEAGDIEKISAGHIINKPSLLFVPIEDQAIEDQVLKLKGN